MTNASPEEVLRFWFGDDLESPDAVAARSQLWFASDRGFDDEVRDRFGELPDHAARGGLDVWREEPRSSLALVLVVDQFPRNLFRSTAQCFAYDGLAREVAEAAIDRGFDAELAPLEATFLYLPLEHAESSRAQERCVDLFRELVERAPAALRSQFETYLSYAIRHQEVIERFGRFPHRNALFGRETTREEKAYLDSGGDTFGG